MRNLPCRDFAAASNASNSKKRRQHTRLELWREFCWGSLLEKRAALVSSGSSSKSFPSPFTWSTKEYWYPPPGWEANVLQVRPPLSILSSFLDNSPVPNCTPGGDLGWREAGPPSEHFVKLPWQFASTQLYSQGWTGWREAGSQPPPSPLSIFSSFLDKSLVPNYTLGGRLGGRTLRVKFLARGHSSVTWPGLEPWALSKARYPEGPKEIQSRTNLCHSYPKTCPQLLCQSQSLLGREIDHRKTFPRHLCCLAPEAD